MIEEIGIAILLFNIINRNFISVDDSICSATDREQCTPEVEVCSELGCCLDPDINLCYIWSGIKTVNVHRQHSWAEIKPIVDGLKGILHVSNSTLPIVKNITKPFIYCNISVSLVQCFKLYCIE